MDNGFVRISEIIKNDPVFDGLRKGIKETETIDKFPEIFPDLNKIAIALKLEKKILFLKVESSVWRSELKFNEIIMVNKINLFFDDERIKHIKFL
jgi:hypothetical protein